ncbi:MAG: PhnD/SsuA/transferrin family substrate-binding protein [Bacteroidota bacterium]|nr:PhnD/SsuA/transferrin family substrate-binding protein [Bacteroidota bacterium]
MNTKLLQKKERCIRSSVKYFSERMLSMFPVFVILFSLCNNPHAQAQTQIKIGVLANRGTEEALIRWKPTANYLTAEIPPHSFAIVPLGYDSLHKAVESEAVDFVITNPSNYVELESAYGTTRIATMKTLFHGNPLNMYGAVIFTKADRNDITDLSDLKGKKFMAVEKGSLGGWQSVWREFNDKGIDPFSDFAELEFTGFPHDLVVLGVRDGKADAGTMRTGILESMAAEGKINLSDFRILNPQVREDFPQLLSTRLYPEWAFAKTKHTPDELAQQVVIALLKLSYESEAARAAAIEGWTVPLDYMAVHELMMELRIGHYKNYGKLTLEDAPNKYWYLIALLIIVIIIGAFIVIYMKKTNIKLYQAKTEIEKERSSLEVRVTERTHELQNRIEEPRRWHNVTLDREDRVRELKKEVNELLQQLGKDNKYSNTSLQ